MEVPTAADYRLRAHEIDRTVCLGRRIGGNGDRRWKPIVYRESQCRRPATAGSDLCAKCTARSEKYAEDPSPRVDWNGRITEEPLAWVHMLGTDWALGKPPVFLGAPAMAPVLAVAEVEEPLIAPPAIKKAAKVPKPKIFAVEREPIAALLELAEDAMNVLKIDRTPAARAKFISEFLAFCYR